MALMGWEWIVVIAIVAVLLLWGPKKLPELARSIGEAKRELKKASEGEAETSKPKEETDDAVIRIAKQLGISTESKTKEQIEQEILQKRSGKK